MQEYLGWRNSYGHTAFDLHGRWRVCGEEATLARMLGHQAEDVRLAAAEALGSIGDEGLPVIPELCQMLANEDSDRESLAGAAHAAGVLTLDKAVR